MVADDTNYWYGSPDIYARFADAEDPLGVSHDFALRHLPAAAKDVLEIGSGTGRLTFHLLRDRSDLKSLVAVDASELMASYLREAARLIPSAEGRLQVLRGAAAALPVANSSVDAVVSSWAFPTRMWNHALALSELQEVHRVLRPEGVLITIGWDERFGDELSELWYRFIAEPDFRRERLDEWRTRRRARIRSPRNCGLTFVARGLRVPLAFPTVEEASSTLGYLFGYAAGEWVSAQRRSEFSIDVGITVDSREQIGARLNGE
jgi:SAM-dependent methyltransferase